MIRHESSTVDLGGAVGGLHVHDGRRQPRDDVDEPALDVVGRALVRGCALSSQCQRMCALTQIGIS